MPWAAASVLMVTTSVKGGEIWASLPLDKLKSRSVFSKSFGLWPFETWDIRYVFLFRVMCGT
jgi:hypothetical protein